MLAIMGDLLHYGATIAHNGFQWLEVKGDLVQRSMPFWSDYDVQRICKNLADKGIIILGSAPYVSSRVIQFALNEQAPSLQPQQNLASPQQSQQPAQQHSQQHSQQQMRAHNQITPGANRMAPNWQPSDDVLRQISQHNIPEHFVREQIPLFITYWRERGDIKHSWGSEFIKHALREWRHHETSTNRQQNREHRWDQERFVQTEQETPMQPSWRPSHDALEVLIKHADINASFVEDSIPEFIIFWQEKGAITSTWNTKFIHHVRRQWARYSSTVEHNSEARLLPKDWQPSKDAFDVLRLANIDIEFAMQQLPEFVLYWRDRKELNNAWNSKFMQHCKFHWARRHHIAAQNNAPGTPQNNGDASNTRDRSLADDLTDRSWAN